MFDGWNDPFAEDVELAGFADPGHGPVDLGDAEFGHRVQVLDRPGDVLAVAPQIEAVPCRLLDPVVVTALVGTVLAEHIELAGRFTEVVDVDRTDLVFRTRERMPAAGQPLFSSPPARTRTRSPATSTSISW
ncbi:MAG TPA: hypothetical protein VHF06_31000 [Pseudonocardiaceae bacterium]|nr:hypothetical protein [Pseudonocardiaceae bacterium]